ncbi:MAG: LacI family DNA-binding transcriptional regulator [Candidatus Ornithospirochaeta sp.]|nr:LacI family DNA-binding transcriptional regulator [Candidatus Ornithospirochaeta sp.]
MATIKDVSRETGLSIGTVSRVFNNRGYISQETRDKVEAAVRKLDYHPNALARSLSKSSSSIIGVILPHIAHPFFSDLLSFIENATRERGYSLMVFVTKGEEESERKMISRCRENRVCGLILCSGRFSTKKIEGNEFPVVAIERNPEGASFAIECDNRQGGRLAAQELIERGCRRIVSLAGIQGRKMPADERSIGFEEVCREHGVAFECLTYPPERYDRLDYTAFIDRILEERPDTDGIFASSDIIASQVLQVAASKGLRVPEDLKVVGFDDSLIASYTTPPLTTIHQPIREIAELAVSTLISLKEKKSASGCTIMNVSLVRRGTT